MFAARSVLSHEQNVDIFIACSKFTTFADDKIIISKFEICLRKDRNHCGKGMECLSPVFSPFFHNDFNSFLCQGHQKFGLRGKGFKVIKTVTLFNLNNLPST